MTTRQSQSQGSSSRLPGRCAHCAHAQGMKCGAFPDGLPLVVILGGHPHDTPLPSDNGIRYEPVEERK